MKTRYLIAALLAVPTIAAADPRIRQIGYDPAVVTTIHGCYGFQLTVAFEPGERIENIALGEAKLWQATPNKRADLLFLKPSVRQGRTNMMVVTDRRRYAFDLLAREDAGCRADRALYELQFAYPQAAAPPPPVAEAAAPPPSAPPEAPIPAPAARNTAYSFTGTVANVPVQAFDDGHATYLRWADGTETPAIYTMGPGKTETVLNYNVRGDYLVVDGVAPAYVLRRGSAVAMLYNDAYQQPKLDADSPRPRASADAPKRSLLARLFHPSAQSPSQAAPEASQ